MSTLGMVQLLYAALVIVMGGLGLSLTAKDFRVLRPMYGAALWALFVQMVALPLVALALAVTFRLPGLLAVGLLILAATPGSISANLFSHLFGGNVAFNVALTGLNTLLCALTMPLISRWAIGHFTGTGYLVPVLMDKALQTLALVAVPVIVGMAIAHKSPDFALKLAKPVKILSALVVVIVSVAAIVKEWSVISDGFTQIGAAVALFNLLSLAGGYVGSRAMRLGFAETMTVTFQVSVHNAIQAIYVALAVLNEPEVALPAAVYSITMNILAVAFGVLLAGRRPRLVAAPA
jgi:bile acid:Na+ symporter, BASS family